VTEINAKLNGRAVIAELNDRSGCLRLVIDDICLEVERVEVRAAITAQATYYGDQGMWWDGYASALNDLSRAIVEGKDIKEWAANVRRKFDLPEPKGEPDATRSERA
jgi:hypothetical protein